MWVLDLKCIVLQWTVKLKKNRCKGIKSSVVKSEIKTKDYVNTLYTHEPKFVYQNGIRSYEHELYSETQYKKALSCNDDKVYICDNNINT